MAQDITYIFFFSEMFDTLSLIKHEIILFVKAVALLS